MELTPGRQRLVFVVIVVALVGLGFFLLRGRGSGGTPAAGAAPSASTQAPTAQPSGVPPSSVPAATPVSTVGGAEIYQWLPFTAADLSAAAQATTDFAKAYSTWSYHDSVAAYAATLSSMVTPNELGQIKSGYSAAGVAGPRAKEKQVSTGSGTIDSIDSFASGTITFYVTITQRVTSTQPATTATSEYAVTVQSSGGGWQVNNLQLATLGNH